MAGGGVGEAMLIGAAVGAGTGGVMSAVKDEDPLQGALLGAAMGAAGGGIGSWAGGAASGAASGAGTGAVSGSGAGAGSGALSGSVGGGGGGVFGTVGGTAEGALGSYAAGAGGAGVGGGSGGLAGAGGATIPGVGTAAGMPIAGTSSTAIPGTTLAGAGGAGVGGAGGSASGLGTGMFPGLTTAQAYGAGVGGGIMGLVGQNAQNQNNMAQEPETYTGPLSQFKYSPSTFRPSIAPGYADGGVASLGRQAGMYPQSQYDKTQFAVPSQMPISREVIGSDYDARISPYTGDMMMASGGISNLGSYSDGGRMLRGPGDGMSDNIPGVIAGKQPARLADGEFVVPADVVSHLGNGSTDAGAKKLYSMMDNVRKARTGTKRQGKQIKADKYVPNMASGGIAYYDEGGDTTSETPAEQPAPAATVPGQGAVASGFQATGYEPSQQYSPYTMANRPSSAQPQYYGDIYQGYYPDYSTPGYTLAGNLGQWSNVAGEQARAAQPASQAQQVTQSYLQNLGRAPDTEGFNNFMLSGLSAPQINQEIAMSPEAYNIGNIDKENYISGLYQRYLGRTPEAAGMQNWKSALGNYLTAEQVRSEIAKSNEAKMRGPRLGIESLV